jgi:hypothetical protein
MNARHAINDRRKKTTHSRVLTAHQRAQFDRSGIVKVEGAFADDQAASTRDVVCGELRHRYDIDPLTDDPSTWYPRDRTV